MSVLSIVACMLLNGGHRSYDIKTAHTVELEIIAYVLISLNSLTQKESEIKTGNYFSFPLYSIMNIPR